MKKLVTLSAIIFCFNQIALGQTDQRNYISKISYYLNVDIDSANEVTSNRNTISGNVKYDYSPSKDLVAVTLFDKNNLNNVYKRTLSYTGKNLSIIDKMNNSTQNSTLDDSKRLSILDFSSGFRFTEPFRYVYKFKYSPDGYLIRVNSYRNDKLKRIHELVYYKGNLVQIKNTYYDDYQLDRTPDYYFEYYDEPVMNNWNLAFSFLTSIDVKYGRCFLMGLPDTLIGKQSKNLLKTLIVHNEGYWQERYKLEYNKNEQGKVLSFFVKNRTQNCLFNIDYL